jgi:transcriptional regulator with XRE-family HTH domain
LTQASLGAPMTRAFVSSVERGRTVPSLPALALLVDRLNLSLSEFFLGVQSHMTAAYTSAHERSSNPSTGHRR